MSESQVQYDISESLHLPKPRLPRITPGGAVCIALFAGLILCAAVMVCMARDIDNLTRQRNRLERDVATLRAEAYQRELHDALAPRAVTVTNVVTVPVYQTRRIDFGGAK